MKSQKLFILLFILLFNLSIQAQNLSRLEELADQLKDQAEDLLKLTSKKIKKRSQNSNDDIEQAFLSEQLLVSAKLVEKLINDKRSASELQYSGRILANMIRRSRRFNSNQEQWQGVNGTINNLNREFRLYVGEAGNKQDEIEDEDRTIVGRVFWRGQVDAEVQLVIRDLELKVNTLSGTTYPPGTHSFTSRLAKDNRLKVGVKKTEGRGKVRVIQQPSVNNNYTTIVQILDSDGGAKEYVIEVFWYR